MKTMQLLSLWRNLVEKLMFRGKAHINNALLSFLFHFHVKEKFLNQWKGEFTYFFFVVFPFLKMILRPSFKRALLKKATSRAIF